MPSVSLPCACKPLPWPVVAAQCTFCVAEQPCHAHVVTPMKKSEIAATTCPCRCIRQYARYTCPRCRLRYCSKECYQQHSQQCTESFSKDSAVAELRSTAASDDERRRMQEILHRVHGSDAGADMAEALGMDSLDLEGTDASAGGNAGSNGGSDEDAVRFQQQPKPCLLRQCPHPQRNRPPWCSCTPQ